MSGHIDGTGAEEQGDLGKGVIDDMDQSTLNTGRGQQGDTHDDIGKLADRGVGQPGLQVVFGQGEDRGHQHGEADKIGGRDTKVEGIHGIDPKDIEHDPGGAEDTDLDDGHGMEKGGDRGRGDHGTGQPVVKGHDAVLGKTEETEDIEHDNQCLVDIGREDAGRDIGGKVEGAGQHIDENHGRQQEGLGGCCQVDNVFPGAMIAFFILMMGDQRIGADGDDLVKEVQGEKIVGEGHTDGTEDGQREAGIEPGLGMFVQAPHISHGIEDGDGPER